MKKFIVNPLLSDVQTRVKKAGQAPGTAIYTGTENNKIPVITITVFNADDCEVVSGSTLDECTLKKNIKGITWINVEGLRDTTLIKTLAEQYHIHPLTVEDILNIEQRPKVEEFDGYLFLTLKALRWQTTDASLSMQQISIIFGRDFILTFQESHTLLFDAIRTKLQSNATQRLRQQNSDYLTYRLIDAMVDEYFVVLENVGEQIETIEERIISHPTPKNSRIIYRLKRQMLMLRKAVWPLREVVSHLLYEENTLVTKFTRIYLRDVYDHTMQAMDTIETFRDMLSSLLDMYLSVLTIRMNEIVKTLTIITTIFIPITALASIYGMNLPDIPLMKSKWGFLTVCILMMTSIVSMILYFRRKKWL